MKHYMVNVPGRHGYSFMLASERDLTDEEIINISLDELDLFEDPENDPDYAMVERFVTEEDVEHFKTCLCYYEV